MAENRTVFEIIALLKGKTDSSFGKMLSDSQKINNIKPTTLGNLINAVKGTPTNETTRTFKEALTKFSAQGSSEMPLLDAFTKFGKINAIEVLAPKQMAAKMILEQATLAKATSTKQSYPRHIANILAESKDLWMKGGAYGIADHENRNIGILGSVADLKGRGKTPANMQTAFMETIFHELSHLLFTGRDEDETLKFEALITEVFSKMDKGKFASVLSSLSGSANFPAEAGIGGTKQATDYISNLAHFFMQEGLDIEPLLEQFSMMRDSIYSFKKMTPVPNPPKVPKVPKVKKVSDVVEPTIYGEYEDGTSPLPLMEKAKKASSGSGKKKLIADDSSVDKLKDKTKKTGDVALGAGKSFGRLQSGLLGVMFTSMGLAGIFGGLIKAGLDMTGIVEVFSAAIGFMMLPIIMVLLPYILGFVNMIFKLNATTRLWIGAFVVVAALIFTIVAGIASIILGILGLIALITFLGPIATKVIGIIALGLLPIAVALFLISAAVIVFAALWTTNFGNFQTHVGSFVKGLEKIYDGFKNVIKGIDDVRNGLINFNVEQFLKGFREIGDGIKTIFEGIFKDLLKSYGGFMTDSSHSLTNFFIESFKEMFAWLTKLPEFVRNVMNATLGKDLTDKIIGPLEVAYNLSRDITDFLAPGSVNFMNKFAASLMPSAAIQQNISTSNSSNPNSKTYMPLASGGIITSPTFAMVGEAGPEAVVPLNKMNQYGTNNHTSNITINATIANNIDIEYLAQRLSSVYERDKRRYFSL